MTSSQIQAACKPLDYPFWFKLDDGSYVSCNSVITLDGGSITFVSGSEAQMLLLHRINACVQHPNKQA